jgi:hypothetical protein
LEPTPNAAGGGFAASLSILASTRSAPQTDGFGIVSSVEPVDSVDLVAKGSADLGVEFVAETAAAKGELDPTSLVPTMVRVLGIAGPFFSLASSKEAVVGIFLNPVSKLAAPAVPPIGDAFANENDVPPTVGEASAVALDTSSFFAGEKSNEDDFLSADAAFTAVGVLVAAAGDDP